MSYPDVFPLAAGSAAVTNLLGASPARFWPFASAPQPGQQGYALPYAVHQLVYGTPENTLACPPDIDLFGIQVDAYARTVTEARQVADALRSALEGNGHVVSLLPELKEKETGLYRAGFTVEFFTPR